MCQFILAPFTFFRIEMSAGKNELVSNLGEECCPQNLNMICGDKEIKFPIAVYSSFSWTAVGLFSSSTKKNIFRLCDDTRT